jgi:uncharacterized protein YabN with tetrapyrrole methylase and pyrophosphatase domain
MRKGSLIVAGTGISVSHLTMEARGWICSAEKVLYCVADAATERLILRLNPNAESLYAYYGEGKPRRETYQQMVDRTMECVRQGQQVCVVYYGHPGIFVNPSHRSIEAARREGFSARMLPAVSSLDCLFCDLGVDPCTGCQILEATDLLLRQRPIDVYTHVIVWQIACVGDLSFSFKGYDGRHLPRLAEYLLASYPRDWEVVVYEAAQFVLCEPVIKRIPLADLKEHQLTGISTLYIPPLQRAPLHLSMLERLDLNYVLEGVKLVPIENGSCAATA